MTVTRIPATRPEHLTRDPVNLEVDVTEKEMVRSKDRSGHTRNARWVVGNVHVKPQYGKPNLVTVWSPCCGRQRQRIQHGYAFSCPTCGWWWRYHCLGWDNRMVSIGKEKPI